jgi:4-amino-4-deoxy-L-arabinose transferase-like glycosyltransferase
VMGWTAARLGAGGGWLAFVFLLGTYGFAVRATVALTDMLLTFLLFSTYVILMPQIAPLARPLGNTEDSAAPDSRWRTVSGGVLLGLAILTKGPLAAVLLALAVFVYLLLMRANPLDLLRCAWPWAVMALSLAVACTWYVPALVAGRAANLAGVFFQENLGHFMPASAGGTGEAARPVYYIALRIIGGSLPLSLLIPAVALSRGDHTATARSDLLYQLSMALAVLLLFSLASAKRDDYILPALPPLAILFAPQFVRPDEANKSSGRLAARFRDATVAGSAATILVGMLAVFIFMRGGGDLRMLGGLASSDESYAAIFAHGIARLGPPFILFGFLMIVGASVALAGVCYARPVLSGAGFGLLCLAGSTLWIGTVKPIEASTRSVARFAAAVRSQVRNASIYVARPDPEMAWYYGRGIPIIPRAVAVSGPSPGMPTYFVGRPADLVIIAPAVRKHMRVIIQSHVLGAGGPPALYSFEATK